MRIPPESSSFSDASAGSPGSGEPSFIVVGRLRRPHGVRGEIVLEVLTDFPERLRTGVTVFIGPEHRPYLLRGRRPIDEGLLVAFRGLSNREEVLQLRNQEVFVRTDDLPALEEGEYYHHQIVGLRVINETGEVLGKVTDIIETGSNDVYVIRPESGREILLPVLDKTILDVNLDRGELRVHLLPGLLPEEQETDEGG
jgi:16S rRNA processing protein RimM